MSEPVDSTVLMTAFLLAFGAGMATTIGAVMPFFDKASSPQFLGCSIAFSAGVMLYVSFVEMFPEATLSFGHAAGSLAHLASAWSSLCLFGGMGLTVLLDLLVHRLDRLNATDHEADVAALLPQPLSSAPESGTAVATVAATAASTINSARDGDSDDEEALLAPSPAPSKRVSALPPFWDGPLTWLRLDWQGQLMDHVRCARVSLFRLLPTLNKQTNTQNEHRTQMTRRASGERASCRPWR